MSMDPIEQALRAHSEKLKRANYIKSFQRANQDQEMKILANEGLDDYLKLIDEPEQNNRLTH